MGFFDWLKKENIPRNNELEESFAEFQKMWELDVDAIWKIADKNDFVIAMYGWICRKCNYGEKLDVLSPGQRNVYLNRELTDEVNNGGFSQYICNGSGEHANEALAALLAIGAEQVAALYRRVLSALGAPIPKGETARMEIFTDEADKVLSECDMAFYEEPDDLVELNYQYIMENKMQFIE